MCTNQKMCGDRIEQDEGLDVLTVEVALGDAEMLFNSSFSCFYQRDNTLKLKRTRERKQQSSRNISGLFVLMFSHDLCKQQF